MWPLWSSASCFLFVLTLVLSQVLVAAHWLSDQCSVVSVVVQHQSFLSISQKCSCVHFVLFTATSLCMYRLKQQDTRQKLTISWTSWVRLGHQSRSCQQSKTLKSHCPHWRPCRLNTSAPLSYLFISEMEKQNQRSLHTCWCLMKLSLSGEKL